MPKGIVPLNDSSDALNVFKAELMPFTQDARGETVLCDLGDYAHIVLDHAEMPSRVRWIKQTLTSPEEIRRHRIFPDREVYINTLYEDERDDDGEMHVVVVTRRLVHLKLWTSFVPSNPERYREQVERGGLLWTMPES